MDNDKDKVREEAIREEAIELKYQPPLPDRILGHVTRLKGCSNYVYQPDFPGKIFVEKEGEGK